LTAVWPSLEHSPRSR